MGSCRGHGLCGHSRLIVWRPIVYVYKNNRRGRRRYVTSFQPGCTATTPLHRCQLHPGSPARQKVLTHLLLPHQPIHRHQPIRYPFPA
jgi:hypothetical protein